MLGEYVYLDENGERYLQGPKVPRWRPATSSIRNITGTATAGPRASRMARKFHIACRELIAAPTTAVIYFCEGEKDADTLAKIGFVATTASEGAAAKWDPALTPYFKDRHVVILPDADRPGRAHAQKVAKAIHGVAASVRILDLYPERHDGSDVSDFIANDTAGVRLAKEVKEAPLWGPSGPTTSAAAAADGAELLADVHAFLGRFVAYPSDHAHVAHTLWIAHAHAMEAWDSTPRIAFLSPEPGSGKTRALEVSEILVPNPVEAVNVTPAYLFRKVGAEEGPPTILYDEIDTVFGPKAKDNEEIRGLLNAGHRRGAVAGRCVVRGKIVETEEIPAYCAVALAGLGWLPDTLMSRSIVIRMRRRAPTETIEPYRRRDEIDEGHELRGRLGGLGRREGQDPVRRATGNAGRNRGPQRRRLGGAVRHRGRGGWGLAEVGARGGGCSDCGWPGGGAEPGHSPARRSADGVRREKAPVEASLFAAGKDLPRRCSPRRSWTRCMPWRRRPGRISTARDWTRAAWRSGSASTASNEANPRGIHQQKGYARADLADAWARYLPPAQTSETIGNKAKQVSNFKGRMFRMFRIALRCFG